MNTKKGFTLIELLVVIAIITVLATIVLAMLGSSRNKGQDAKILSQIGQMTSQGFLFSGTCGACTGTKVAGPVNTGIANPVAAGTTPLQIFNATTSSLNSLYLLGSTLPGSPYIYYGWNGADPNTTGAWFFAASISTGAFCNDHKGTKKTYTSATPIDILGEFTTAFPNATVAGGYRCD